MARLSCNHGHGRHWWRPCLRSRGEEDEGAFQSVGVLNLARPSETSGVWTPGRAAYVICGLAQLRVA